VRPAAELVWHWRCSLDLNSVYTTVPENDFANNQQREAHGFEVEFEGVPPEGK
jgi:hypothetical protein